MNYGTALLTLGPDRHRLVSVDTFCLHQLVAQGSYWGHDADESEALKPMMFKCPKILRCRKRGRLCLLFMDAQKTGLNFSFRFSVGPSFVHSIK